MSLYCFVRVLFFCFSTLLSFSDPFISRPLSVFSLLLVVCFALISFICPSSALHTPDLVPTQSCVPIRWAASFYPPAAFSCVLQQPYRLNPTVSEVGRSGLRGLPACVEVFVMNIDVHKKHYIDPRGGSGEEGTVWVSGAVWGVGGVLIK